MYVHSFSLCALKPSCCFGCSGFFYCNFFFRCENWCFNGNIFFGCLNQLWIFKSSQIFSLVSILSSKVFSLVSKSISEFFDCNSVHRSRKMEKQNLAKQFFCRQIDVMLLFNLWVCITTLGFSLLKVHWRRKETDFPNRRVLSIAMMLWTGCFFCFVYAMVRLTSIHEFH